MLVLRTSLGMLERRAISKYRKSEKAMKLMELLSTAHCWVNRTPIDKYRKD